MNVRNILDIDPLSAPNAAVGNCYQAQPPTQLFLNGSAITLQESHHSGAHGTQAHKTELDRCPIH
jgi:hypothetical protein